MIWLKTGDAIVHPGEIAHIKSHFKEQMCTYKSLTREEAHKTNQVHEGQIKKEKKICQSHCFHNRLLLLTLHCSHLDEDLLYFQVCKE